MATTHTQRLNEFARRQGYKNYYQLRKARAQAMGYESYEDQRKARKTGNGLRGGDANNPRYVRQAPPPPPPRPRPTPRRDVWKPTREDILTTEARNRLHGMNPKSRVDQIAARIHQRHAMLVDRQLRIANDPAKELAGQRGVGNREEMLNLIRESGKDSLDFFDLKTGPLGRIYQDAAKAANPAYQLGPDDAEILRTIVAQGQSGVLTAAEFAQQDVRRWGGNLREVKANFKTSQDLSPYRWALDPKNQIKAKIYADGQRHNLASYSELSMRAAAQRAHNLAIAQASGVEWFWVNDGSDCGWTFHDDNDKANASVRNLEDVLSYPIAHPNCQRNIEPLFFEGPKGKGRKAKDIIVAGAKAQAGSLALDLAAEGVRALATNTNIQAKAVQILSRAVPGAWQTRIQTFVKTQKAHVPPGVTDINAYRVTAEQAEQAISDAQWDIAEGRATGRRMRQFLGVPEEVREVPLPKAVGDEFDHFVEYRNRTTASRLSVGGEVEAPKFMGFTEDELFSMMGDLSEKFLGTRTIGDKFGRFTFPRVGFGEKTTAGRFAIEPNRLINATITKTQRGIVNHLGFNRHGLFRAGVARDPVTGLWSPTFRLIPRGPIRVMAKVNRSKGRRLIIENLGPGRGGSLNVAQEGAVRQAVRLTTDELFQLNSLDTGDTLRLGDFVYEKLGPDEVLQGRGRVTSISWEARLITKTPVNFSATFNTNLRSLGIHSWRDIRNMSVSDFRKIGLADTKFVSAAAEARAGGLGPIELAKTFRINSEQAQELWELTSKWVEAQVANPAETPRKIIEGIQAQIADTIARRRRARFMELYDEDLDETRWVRERLERMAPFVDERNWFKYENRRNYRGTKVLAEDADIGTVVRSGPAYVTVEWESGVTISYQWETVNERLKILKEIPDDEV